MPNAGEWSHISLSVTDLAASEKWFTEVLGLEVLDRIPHHDGWEAVICGNPLTRLILEAQCHDANAGQPSVSTTRQSQPAITGTFSPSVTRTASSSRCSF